MPNLFPVLKRRVDLFSRKGGPSRTIIRLTGSNQILLDKNVKESLAGRASFFDMNTLSLSEIKKSLEIPNQEILYRGGYPALYKENRDPKKYLDDYINSYVEKDIVLSAGIQKSNEFLKCLGMLAGRVGEIIDYSNLAKDIGVDSKTIKEWVSVLEKMGIVSLVPPFYSNLGKRLIKSPKIYFNDTGLACRLQGWTDPRPILTSPQQGHLFENLVFSEILKLNLNFQLGIKIFHWRSRDGEEVDFLLQYGPQKYLFLESKVSYQKLTDISKFPEVKKVFKENIPDSYLCHQEVDRIINKNVPIQFLYDHLISILGNN